jgi:hypothetical protein
MVWQEWSDGETVLWGGISGALAGFTTTPLDVVKTRIMTETQAGENRKFKVCSRLPEASRGLC